MNHHLMSHGHPLTIFEVNRRMKCLASPDRANQRDCGPFANIMLGNAPAAVRRLTGENRSRRR